MRSLPPARETGRPTGREVLDLEVSRNRVTTSEPSTNGSFGAIRDVDGARLVENVLTGPWANGMALTNFNYSAVRANVVAGALQAAIRIDGRENDFGSNRVGADGAGFALFAGCRNTVEGLVGTTAGPLLHFAEEAGDNVALLGNPKSTWVDDGIFDCDGDGEADPSRVIAARPGG